MQCLSSRYKMLKDHPVSVTGEGGVLRPFSISLLPHKKQRKSHCLTFSCNVAETGEGCVNGFKQQPNTTGLVFVSEIDGARF